VVSSPAGTDAGVAGAALTAAVADVACSRWYISRHRFTSLRHSSATPSWLAKRRANSLTTLPTPVLFITSTLTSMLSKRRTICRAEEGFISG